MAFVRGETFEKEDNKKFTIQYTKDELDKIQNDFLEQLSEYIARVNNRILRTMEEIEKDAEIVPPSTTVNFIKTKQNEEAIQ